MITTETKEIQEYTNQNWFSKKTNKMGKSSGKADLKKKKREDTNNIKNEDKDITTEAVEVFLNIIFYLFIFNYFIVFSITVVCIFSPPLPPPHNGILCSREKEGRSSYPLRQHGWNWRALC